MELLTQQAEPPAFEVSRHTETLRRNIRNVVAGIVSGIRSFDWDYLSQREIELHLSAAAEEIFKDHRKVTDQFLGEAAPSARKTKCCARPRPIG